MDELLNGPAKSVRFRWGRDGYIAVRGREHLARLADDIGWSSTWVECFVLENVPCRRLGKAGDRLLTVLDFTRIGKRDLEPINERWLAIPSGFVFDRIHPQDLARRLPLFLAGSPVTSPGIDPVEGRAGPDHFLFSVNDLHVADPLTNLNSHFVVWDNGTLFQWKFAEFVPGGLTATDVDVARFQDAFQRFRNRLDGEPNEGELRRSVERLVEARNALKTELMALHERNREQSTAHPMPGPLPRLGRFDRLQTTGDTFHVQIDMAPVYFRAAVRHVLAAKGEPPSDEPISMGIYSETIPAIIMAHLALDAHVNMLGFQLGVPNWERTLEGPASLESKIGSLSRFPQSSTLWRHRPDMRRDVENITGLRNELVHFSRPSWNVHDHGGSVIADVYGRTGLTSAEQTLRQIVKILDALHDYVGLPRVMWTRAAPGWLEKDEASFLN